MIQRYCYALAAHFLLLLIPALSCASSWPVFIPPDLSFLNTNSYIDTNSCPYGQGKLMPNISINIREKLCRTYCMDSWFWKGKSDNACHDLASEFELQGYEITHYRDNDGITSHSEVVANYGRKGSNIHSFQFAMMTVPGEAWYCVQYHPNSPNIVCANDT